MVATQMTHLRCTYLGWQGWCISGDTACIAFDPLLLDEVGRGPKHTRMDYHFRAARAWNTRALPAVDGVIITHEHEDHFNIPTLARIERSVPLYISDAMSSAARNILAEMGFSVTYVSPGQVVDIGDLEIRFFGPNHLHGYPYGIGDEWDTLGYAVRQTDGHGVFMTNVDIAPTPEMTAFMDKHAHSMDVITFMKMKLRFWSKGATLTGQHGEHSGAGHRATLDADRDAETLSAGDSVIPFPGQTLIFTSGHLEDIQPRTDYLYTLPRSEWPVRKAFFPPSEELPQAPVTGEFVSASERIPLERCLRELAEYLYGRWHYRFLLSIRGNVRTRKPTFALVFGTDEESDEWVYEYSLHDCDFRRVAIDLDTAADRYVGIVVMWASDFLAVAQGRVEARNIYRATQEDWAVDCPPGARFTRVMWTCYHPLRFPERTLAQYRRTLKNELDATPLLQATQKRDDS